MSDGRERLTSAVTSRRGFLSAAALALVATRGGAQTAQGPEGATAAQGDAAQGAANVPMNQGAYRPVRRPAKPGATPQLDQKARDDLEHKIACQCGCTLDVFTCRTTDFSCGISPAMHADVVTLIEGGYSAQEIIDAFLGVYGEQVLMAPKKEGFNLLGYYMPYVALTGGAVAAVLLLRHWRRVARVRAAESPVAVALPSDATPDELARIEAAVRENA